MSFCASIFPPSLERVTGLGHRVPRGAPGLGLLERAGAGDEAHEAELRCGRAGGDGVFLRGEVAPGSQGYHGRERSQKTNCELRFWLRVA